MKSFRIFLTALAAFAICSSLTLHAQDNVQRLADQWTASYNLHDIAGLGAMYTETAHLMMHGAPTHIGREAIVEFWTKDIADGNPLMLLTVTHSIDGVDMTLVHGNYQVVDHEDGSILGQGRFAHIWILTANGEWKLDRDLWAPPST